MQATRAPRDKLYAGDKHSFGVRRGREQGPDSLYLGGICQWRNQGSEPTSPNLVLTQPPHLHLLAAPWGLAQSKDEAGEAVVVQGLRQIQGPQEVLSGRWSLPPAGGAPLSGTQEWIPALDIVRQVLRTP